MADEPPSTSSEVLIRHPQGEADVRAVHELQLAWAAERITYGLAADEPAQLRSRLAGPHALVAEHAGAVVGFVTGEPRVSPGLAVVQAGEPYLELEALYVAPAYRGRGVGSRLVEQWLALARHAGITRVLAYSANRDAHRTLAFYERHGFRSWYVQLFQDL